MNRFLLAFAVVIFTSCSSNKKMADTHQPQNTPLVESAFDKQGHRGCRGLMPENSIPAMLHALDLGVTTLEMDIVFTKDSVAILSHEPFFNHEITTKPDGSFIDASDEKDYNIFNMSFAETKRYDVGLKPHPRFARQQRIAAYKPSLAEVFDAVKNDMMTRRRPFPFFNIETKTHAVTDNVYHPAPAAFVELLMKVIKEKNMEESVMIQSFDPRTLQYLHQHYPAIPTVLLIEDYDKRSLEEQLKELGFVPTVYSPDHSLITAALIEKCHRQQIKVIPWTVNDKASIDKLKAMDVDGIISDYPNLL